jgi:hypothetical protein
MEFSKEEIDSLLEQKPQNYAFELCSRERLAEADSMAPLALADLRLHFCLTPFLYQNSPVPFIYVTPSRATTETWQTAPSILCLYPVYPMKGWHNATSHVARIDTS